MATFKKLTKRGFTLIELMIVVVIIGILASLAIYGVQKYVANSKSAEARMILGRMSKDAVSKFEGEEMTGGLIAQGASRTISHELCPAATATIPTSITAVAASKYQPTTNEWASNGWACLGTSVTTPIYYMYGYDSNATAGTPSVAGDNFLVAAAGDLDGDSVTSLFTMQGLIAADNSGGLTAIVSPTVTEARPEE